MQEIFAVIFFPSMQLTQSALHLFTKRLRERASEAPLGVPPTFLACVQALPTLSSFLMVRKSVQKFRFLRLILTPHETSFAAGNVFQGTLFFYQFRGVLGMEFMNMMNYTAANMGIREFDAGIDDLATAIDSTPSAVLETKQFSDLCDSPRSCALSNVERES